ncbi:hypothetical protein [Nonomuraea jiangxiensis]|uniref:SCO6045-like C-terminal domain-containing protein n=1 Tax=Nonomuraea jiangxiensis TaxID=633440 RepID=A0A1G8NQF1_9ACTN|nr:hypothetical protein [Nonomuraea jiangxiensis]SDI82418.1 hypothetical protein SAMN05421869_107193 [Nonomuraea jiangxiensis]
MTRRTSDEAPQRTADEGPDRTGEAATDQAADEAVELAVAQRWLAEAQGRVVAALVGGAEPPAGFDPERMRAQAASLVSKRRGIVARIRPDVAAAAGADLAAEFAAYARARTAPAPGYRTDADDFAAWLRERGRLPDPPRRPRWWSRFLP